MKKFLEREKLAKLAIFAIVILTVVSTVHILLPPKEVNHYNVDEPGVRFYKKVGECSYEFTYINTKNNTVSVTEVYDNRNHNIHIPETVEYNGIVHKVLTFEDDYYWCDTLFVPASIAYVNVVKARFVEVDPDNKYYKSVNGALYRGDELIFEPSRNENE